jgi:IS1 family transposase
MVGCERAASQRREGEGSVLIWVAALALVVCVVVIGTLSGSEITSNRLVSSPSAEFYPVRNAENVPVVNSSNQNKKDIPLVKIFYVCGANWDAIKTLGVSQPKHLEVIKIIGEYEPFSQDRMRNRIVEPRLIAVLHLLDYELFYNFLRWRPSSIDNHYRAAVRRDRLLDARQIGFSYRNPRSLIQSHGVLCCADAGFRIVGSRRELIDCIGHSAVNILSRIGELLSGVGLVGGSIGRIRCGSSHNVSIKSTLMHLVPLETHKYRSEDRNTQSNLGEPDRGFLKPSHFALYVLELICGCWLCFRSVYWLGYFGRKGHVGFLLLFSGYVLAIHGGVHVVLGLVALRQTDEIVTQKDLTTSTLCNTVTSMANVLSTDKQIAVIGALAEGSSIRSIERITGVHRDTIMRLGVRVGQGCAGLLDAKMRDLPCRYLQFDEVWGFIGKKERHLRVDDDPQYGDVWTFCAIDAETKLVPTFKVGKRDLATAKAFVSDLHGRLANRVQISSDALRAYVDAIEQSFGADVDFGQIVKTYEHDYSQHPEYKYSAPTFVAVDKRAVTGSPDMNLVSTSYIERLNATTRLHMRRLTRLTLAFSKKLENFQAAVALHFAYYNLVKRHGTLRCTPAMAAGIERDFWSVGQLVESVL